MLNSDPDLALIHACQATDANRCDDPFRELYERYKTRVYHVCFRITGNAHDALDASQDVFVTLFDKIRSFRQRSRFSSWVYRIAVNASIDRRRRAAHSRLPSLDDAAETEHLGDQTLPRRAPLGSPAEQAADHELGDAVDGAVRQLSNALRATVVLRYTRGLSYDEISESLGIAVGTVKSRLFRAHRALEHELQPIVAAHA